MIDNSRVKFDDGCEYIVIDKIKTNKGYYVYLSNAIDSNDFFVRKEIEKNNETFLVGLKNEEEVNDALKLFLEKNQNN